MMEQTARRLDWMWLLLLAWLWSAPDSEKEPGCVWVECGVVGWNETGAVRPL